MKSAANKLVLAILPVLMVITCNQESSVSSPERSLPREDPTLYGYSLWLIRMQEKLDNGYQLNDHTEYDNLIQGFALNTERVTLYLPTAPTYSSSMTENELLEYLGIMDNFSLNKGWVFFNHLEKNTIFLVLPDENPFSNDTIYYDFLTTYYEGADTIISALQIYDKIPSLLAHYLNSEPMKLSKSTSIIPVNGVCSNTDDWTNLGDIEAHYYTIIEYSLMLGFAGDKVKELLTEDLIGIIKAGSGGETIDFILDQIKQMTYLQFIDYLYDKGAISEALYTYLRTRNDWGARIDRYRLMLTQSNAINECSQQDARFLRYLCMNNFGNYNPAYDLDFKDFCSEYDQACQSIYSLQGVQLFFYFTGDQRTYFCASCDAELPKSARSNSEDTDGDGYVDGEDNCPCTPQNNQADFDIDGVGDVCDDKDGDGVVDAIDNCRYTFNPDQADVNENGIGDVCDADFYNFNPEDCAQDSDGDGIVNCIDNCPTKPNSDQLDTDNDGVGDVCDNCPELFNISQDFAPCDIGEPEADPNCDQTDIDEEREQYRDFIDDIFACVNDFGQQYDSRHVESELEGDAYSDPERICLHSTIESRLGRDVLCAWWLNNPAWQLIGSTGAPVWGDYDAECGNAEDVEMTTEIRNIINEIVICCKSEADIGGLIARREMLARILNCIPEDEPSFHCLNIKPQLRSLRDYYQLELDRMNDRIQITNDHINQYCTQ